MSLLNPYIGVEQFARGTNTGQEAAAHALRAHFQELQMQHEQSLMQQRDLQFQQELGLHRDQMAQTGHHYDLQNQLGRDELGLKQDELGFKQQLNSQTQAQKMAHARYAEMAASDVENRFGIPSSAPVGSMQGAAQPMSFPGMDQQGMGPQTGMPGNNQQGDEWKDSAFENAPAGTGALPPGGGVMQALAPNVSGAAPGSVPSSQRAKQIAAGIAKEIRRQIGSGVLDGMTSDQVVEHIGKLSKIADDAQKLDGQIAWYRKFKSPAAHMQADAMEQQLTSSQMAMFLKEAEQEQSQAEYTDPSNPVFQQSMADAKSLDPSLNDVRAAALVRESKGKKFINQIQPNVSGRTHDPIDIRLSEIQKHLVALKTVGESGADIQGIPESMKALGDEYLQLLKQKAGGAGAAPADLGLPPGKDPNEVIEGGVTNAQFAKKAKEITDSLRAAGKDPAAMFKGATPMEKAAAFKAEVLRRLKASKK